MGHFLKAKMCTFALEPTHFVFNKYSIYTHVSASAKFSTNSHETDYSVLCYPFVSSSAKFGICIVVVLNGTLVEDNS